MKQATFPAAPPVSFKGQQVSEPAAGAAALPASSEGAAQVS